jgi:hypothetical protein
MHRERGRTTYLDEAVAVRLHPSVVREPPAHVIEHSRGIVVRRRDDAIVHPAALSSSGDNAGAPQVGEMARDLGLRSLEDLDEETDAHLVVAEQIQ